MSKVNFRRYHPGDEEGIVELLDETFSGWPQEEINCSPIDYWRWKYHDNPLHELLVSLGEVDGKIIGCHHRIPLKIWFKGKTLIATTAVDFAVHKDYRGQGLSYQISSVNMRAGEQHGADLSYFITSNPLLIRRYTQDRDPNKRTLRFPKRIRNMVHLHDVDLQLQKMPMSNPWVIKMGWYTLKTLNQIANWMKPRPGKHEIIRIKEVERFDECINQFWSKMSNSYDFIVERRMEYLNWRYCDPRLKGYKVNIALDEHEEIQGYIVYKTNNYIKDYPVGYIVDLITLDNQPGIQHCLLETAVTYFRENNVNVINYQLIEGHPHQEASKRLGFLDSRINLHLFYNKVEEFTELEALSHNNPSRVYISWGDHDVLPVKMPTQT